MDIHERRELERRGYLEGIRRFNAREFFEAHEAWEDAWRLARGVKHEFYQGLIQIAVALVHYQRSNPRGVLNLRRRYLKHLGNLPPQLMGLDLAELLREMEHVLQPLTTASPLPGKGQVRFDESRAPLLTLRYDPFESGEAARLDSSSV